ncbi:hypothetical protein [Sphingomonas sp. PP-CC-3A-396]|uniref:hypothetical protein n=1 Tax=Sphingomonas sp. PP-CC-3A-396 TaxID=2135655 RepID=UPI0010E08BAD|nr:hypothetical protein [Sphingomonas sp. PP-CC-3A-396]TCQ06535.1 hypothetical protein C8J40_105324 [Sphingomonas sp. PP-CC-3A-396]
MIEGFGANHHLRQSLVFLEMPTMQQSETYLGNSPMLFDDSGALIDGPGKTILTAFADALVAWVAFHRPAAA